MNNIILKIGILLAFVFIKDAKANEESEEYDAGDAVSLNSESNEKFNVSSKENFIDSEDISEMGNETIAIHRENDIELAKKVKNFDKPALKSTVMPKGSRTSKEVIRSTNTMKPKLNYPFSVSVQRKSSHYTSGALVDKQWVLTTAGDFYNVRESIKIFRVRLGSVNCKKGGVLIPIKQVEVHPSYVPNKAAFDLALLKLGNAIEYDESVAPIAISQTRGRVVSATFLATYWPRLIVREKVLPASAKEQMKKHSMRVSTQKLIPWDQCRKKMDRINVTLEPSSHCLEPIVSHHSHCRPDPGAPVLAKDGLWGITSGWTPKRCHKTSSPTIFTRLSSPRIHSWLQLLLVDL